MKTFNLHYIRDLDDQAFYIEPTVSCELPTGVKDSFDRLISSTRLIVEFCPSEHPIDVYLRSEKYVDWATKLTRVYAETYYCLYVAQIDGKRILAGYQYRRFKPKFFVKAWGSEKIKQLDDATGLLYRLADSQTRYLMDMGAMYEDLIRNENLLQLDVTYSDDLNASAESQSDTALRSLDNTDDPVFDSLISDSPNLLTDDEDEVYSRRSR